MIEETDQTSRQKLIGAALITLALGLFGVAVMGLGNGIISAGMVAVALIIAKNI